jgi:hypothetical protein
MAATKKPTARLADEDLRFVKFIGKCIRIQPGFTDQETAETALECFSDWYHVIAKNGLTELPAAVNPGRKGRAKKVLAPVPAAVSRAKDSAPQPSAEERAADAWWASLKPTERMWIFGRFDDYMTRHR